MIFLKNGILVDLQCWVSFRCTAKGFNYMYVTYLTMYNTYNIYKSFIYMSYVIYSYIYTHTHIHTYTYTYSFSYSFQWWFITGYWNTVPSAAE